MLRLRLLLSCAPSCLWICACGDDGGGSGAESSSSTSTTEATTTGSSTTDAEGTTSTSSGADSTSETGPVTLSVSGVVEDFFVMEPIGFAQISLLDEPGWETVSNADGTFSIDDLQPDSFHRVRLDENATYWGAIVPVQLQAQSIDDFDLSQVSTEVIDLQVGALQQQDPTVVVDEQAAVFLVALRQNTATGATVTIDPAPPMGTYYAPDVNGAPVLNQNVIEWGLYPVAVFFNLPPGDAGTYTIDVTHPERECTVEDPQPPTLARHVNLVYVDCPSP